jgi:hypothetical protein
MDGKLVLDHGTRMILAAAILLFGIYSTASSSQDNPAPVQSTAQSASSGSSSQSNSEPAQNPTPEANAPPKSTPSLNQGTTQTPKKSAAKKPSRKKKASIAPCDVSTGQAGTSNSSATSATQTSGAPATPPVTNCPPPKVIVQQGGTAEPSIQLAGGDQASQKRAAVNQMLGSTEANLKKIAELQLSDAQKGTVLQIRQFVDQSKAALAEGDVERGHTLAWKAQLLSEDLIQPQK